VKFLCGNCKAKYQISDEKVAGRTLRMTCRHCKEEILIRGTSLSAPPQTMSLTPPEPAGSVYPVSGSVVPEVLRASQALAAPSPIGAEVGHPSQAPPPPPPPPRASVQPPPLHLEAWHVAIGDAPAGPMRREEVAARVKAGEVTSASLAWREGMDDWLPAGEIPDLRALFGSQAAPVAPTLTHGGTPPALPTAGRASTTSAVSPRDSAMLPDRVPGTQNWALMFALAGGFVLAMTAMIIFGVHLLREEPKPAAAPPAAAAPVVAEPELELPDLEELDEQAAGDEETEAEEVALEEVEVETEPTTAAPRAKTASRPKKEAPRELTASEREMLARMGGGDTTPDPSRLRASTSSTGAGTAPRGEPLTAAQLTQVVQRGRESLQRCYEKSLRASGGSTETVRMDVAITVSPSGNVTQANVTGNGLPGMKECLARTVRMWRFPEAGDTTQTKFPLVFQPGG